MAFIFSPVWSGMMIAVSVATVATWADLIAKLIAAWAASALWSTNAIEGPVHLVEYGGGWAPKR